MALDAGERARFQHSNKQQAKQSIASKHAAQILHGSQHYVATCTYGMGSHRVISCQAGDD